MTESVGDYLVHGQVFERCQAGDADEMRAFNGEAGFGVYAYPISHRRAMRPYYSSRDETIFLLRMKPQATMVDLTKPSLMADLLAYSRSRIAARVSDKVNYVYYQPSKVTASNVQRFGGLIEDFIRERFPDVSGWIVPHKGPGLPSGKQAVIRRIEDFDIEQSS